MATAEKIEKYGLQWPVESTPLNREMWFIQHGGTHTKKDGTVVGFGLSHHFHQMRKIIWPELDDEDRGQRWHKLCRDTICAHPIVCLMGPASVAKTHEAAWWVLCDWMCFPKDTCVLVSSTDMRGLRLRVWGEIASLWERAVERFPELPGHMIDSKLAITEESVLDADGELNDRTARDFRSAIIGIPTIQGGKFVGIGKFLGIKQKRVRLVGDELAQMGGSFLAGLSNLSKNPDFKSILIGNPNDPLDCLGRAAEPKDGWDGHMEPTKTEVWDTRFMDGKCINLIGLDSPNNDFPEDKKPRFPYLIHKRKIDETAAFFGRDSYEFYSQSVGAMKIATLARRILTRRLCEDNGALLPHADWDGPRTKIAALDAAYGGDRCLFIAAEFGKSVGGKITLLLSPPMIVPISPKSTLEPEDQIAAFVKRECEGLGVLPRNFFHDSTGRGSLGTSLARAWSADCNPVEFGGIASKRPVSLDHFITDRITNERRLLRCDEFYTHFVVELWFSVRFAIEAAQLRGMTQETMDEGCMREWRQEKNDRRSTETKTEMKVRLGRSPDLMDAVAIVVEGARRRGFQISKLANDASQSTNRRWFDDLAREQRKLMSERELVRA